MTKSLENIKKRTIHSNSTPVIVKHNSTESEADTVSARHQQQELLIDTLARKCLAEQENHRVAETVISSESNLVSAPTMSIRSNYSEIILNGGVAPSSAGHSYTPLDFSAAQHTGTNPSYSSYDGGDHNQHSHHFYREEHRSTTATSVNNGYQDVIAIDEAPVYVPSSASSIRNKSATASYNSYKSLRSGTGNLPNCEIKPVWVLTKVTRYVTRTIKREKISP